MFLSALLATFCACLLSIAADGLRDELHNADLAVVLGNRVYASGRPSPALQARLDHTVTLYRGGYFDTAFVSGGIGREGHDEAKVMRDYLVAHGVPAERIVVDSAGVDTFSTARNAARYMREHNLRSALVITQYFHITRSKLALRRSGIDPVYASHAPHFAWKDPYSLVREVAGLVAYSLRSYE